MKDQDDNTLLMMYVTHLHSFYRLCRIPKPEVSIKRIAYLIEKGVNVNHSNKDKETVLSISQEERSNEIFQYLIEYHLQQLDKYSDKRGFLDQLYCNSILKSNTTENINKIFCRLCGMNNLPLIKEFYKFYKDVIDIDYHRESLNITSFMHALQFRHIDVAKYLFELGANYSINDIFGGSVLLYAFSCGDMDFLIAILIKIIGINYMDVIHNMKPFVELYGEVTLHEINVDSFDGEFEDNKFEKYDSQIHEKLNIDLSRDENGNKTQLTVVEFQKLIWSAVSSNNLDIVKFAFEFPVDVNFPNCDVYRNKNTNKNIQLGGMTPLMHAAFGANIEIIEYLINKGANIHYTAGISRVYDCLTSAIGRGNIDVVQFFISLGLRINMKYEMYNALRTALDEALVDRRRKVDEKYIEMYQRREQIVILLLENGANPNKYTGSDMGYISSSMLFLPCSYHMNNILRELLKHGADVNYFDGDGDNVVRRCIASGNQEGLKMVLDHGFDISKLNEEERSYIEKYQSIEEMILFLCSGNIN